MGDKHDALGEGIWSSYGRVLEQDLFFHLLDLEVKRAQRYQSYVCLLFLKLKELSDHPHRESFETYFEILTDLLTVEMRETDIIGQLPDHQLVALLPYADDSAGGAAQSRFENTLKYFNLKEKGYEVMINQVCFPTDGTDVREMIRNTLREG